MQAYIAALGEKIRTLILEMLNAKYLRPSGDIEYIH